MSYISVPETALKEAKIIMPDVDIRGDLFAKINEVDGNESIRKLREAGIINFVFKDTTLD